MGQIKLLYRNHHHWKTMATLAKGHKSGKRYLERFLLWRTAGGLPQAFSTGWNFQRQRSLSGLRHMVARSQLGVSVQHLLVGGILYWLVERLSLSEHKASSSHVPSRSLSYLLFPNKESQQKTYLHANTASIAHEGHTICWRNVKQNILWWMGLQVDNQRLCVQPNCCDDLSQGWICAWQARVDDWGWPHQLS